MTTLYEASAGTGKTHQLVDLYTARVAAGDPVERLLVVTFTEAAAAELRDRIQTRVAASAPAHVGALAHAEITTIHGFCARALRRHAAECGYAPGLRLVPAATAAIDTVVADFHLRASSADPGALTNKALAPDTLAGVARLALRHPSARLNPGRTAVGAARATIAEAAREEVPARLARAGQVTFDGLVRAVHDGLAQPAFRAALQARYDTVFIDEFQDTDPLQWAIFSKIFDDRMVLIGDPKQAIYGFRQADVFTYQRVSASLTPIRLDRNHRSDAPLVAAINRVFTEREVFRHPSLPAPPVTAEHTRARVRGDDRAALTVRVVPGGESIDDAVAQDVAEDIAATLASGVEIHAGEAWRPAGARDCAVLTRSHAQADRVRAALEALGVACAMRSRASVYETAAATEWARVLTAVASPGQAGDVKAALGTRLFGLDARAIHTLDDGAWDAWAERLERWEALWINRGPLALQYAVLDETGGYARLLAQVDGARYLTDLRHVAEQQQIQVSGDPCARQIEWLGEQASAVVADDARLRRERDGDAVTITTVHASKGLAYPMVWVPFAWWSPRPPRGPRDPVVFHDEAGAAVLALDPDDRALSVAQDERGGEDTRLLYVALTRAQHRLVVHWANGDGAGASALRRLLLSGVGLADTDAVMAALRRWAEPGVLAVEPAEPRPASAPARIPVTLSQRVVRPPPPDPTWRRTSFSGLTREAHGDPPEAAPDPALSAPVPLARFVAGARVGTLIHAVLEHADFADPASIAAETERQAGLHGLAEPRAQQLASALQQVVRTPLSDFALADLSPTDRLDELGFYLPVRGGFDAGSPVAPADLAEVMRRHPGPGLPPDYPDRLAHLPAAPFRGFLSGAIDLVFQRAGRWYLADYKSNHLGETFGDYCPSRLADAVSRAHYALQYHLYCLALHRHLTWRVPGYDYDQHFGGSFYLFLRGMSPAHGAAAGVFFDRPSKALIEGWSALFGEVA